MRAIEMYNPNGGASFGHYASLRIEGKIREYLGNEGLIHIPANIKAERGRYLRVVEGIRKTTGKEPAPEEIATQLEMPLERITRLQEDLRVGHSFTSLDELIEDEGRHAVEEFYAAQNEMLEEEEKKQFKKALEAYVSRRLSPRHERVFRMYYPGIFNNRISRAGEEHTLDSIGKALGVTGANISARLGRDERDLRYRIDTVGIQRFIQEELKALKRSKG